MYGLPSVLLKLGVNLGCPPMNSKKKKKKEPKALWDDGDPPPREGSSEPSACTQHFPGASSEASRDGGSSLEDPRASMSVTLPPVEPEPVAPAAALGLSFRACKLLRSAEKMVVQRECAASQSASPAPSISSVLGSTPPLHPPLLRPHPRRWAPLSPRLHSTGAPGCNTNGPFTIRTTQASPCR